MKRRLAVLLSFVSFAALLPVAANAGTSLSVGNVTFSDDGTMVTLGNGSIERTWMLSPAVLGGSARTSGLRDVQTGTDWAANTTAADFTLMLVNGLSVSSSDLRVRNVGAAPAPRGGIAVTFEYEAAEATDPPALPKTVWIERTVTLNDDASVMNTTTTLHNGSPVPLVLQAYTLDEIASSLPIATAAAEVHAYVGGSDWRDDFRHASTQNATSFDVEGEVLRTGTDEGWFFVSERRGGAASRVGRTDHGDGSVTTYAGADFARDLVDLGPLATTPPDYNRVENPAYPVPIRARRIAPLSDFILGSVATGVYHGGGDEAAANYANWVARYRMPQNPRRVQLNSFHPWSHGPDFNWQTIQKQADEAAALGIDTIILDDQWQGGPGGESGDWQWDGADQSIDGDVARFPGANPTTGKPADIVDYIHSKGLRLGLWMSPAEFSGTVYPCSDFPPKSTCSVGKYDNGQPTEKTSVTAATHPEWICTPTGLATSQVNSDVGLGVWDFTNPDLQSYMTSVISRAVGWGVSYFKFDFQAWADCPPHDYNDYNDAFAHWVNHLEELFPAVTFTFDETNDQRMYAFESVARGPSWFDNAHPHDYSNNGGCPNPKPPTCVKAPAQLLHDVWMASPWIPPSTIGAGTFDNTLPAYSVDYLMPIAALTHMTFWTDLTKLTASQKADTAWWLDWYHVHSADLAGAVYNLTGTATTADPWDDQQAAAFQTWNGDHGWLFAFRQGGAAPVVHLRGLDANTTYTLTNVRDGSVLGTFDGATLTSGLSIPLGSAHTAAVYAITG